MVIGSLVLRLATVSSPLVGVLLLPFAVSETKGRAPELLCRMYSNVGRRPFMIRYKRGVPLEGGGVPIVNLGYRERRLFPFRSRECYI